MEIIPNKKRESGISRIVGVEESVERELLDYFKKQFEKDEISTHEMEHAPELDALLSQINEKMKEFMARYGIRSLEIPSRNIHVIDRSSLSLRHLMLEKQHERTVGSYSPHKQQIMVLEDYTANNKLFFTQTLVHEMMHANSFGSLQKVKEGGTELIKGGELTRLGMRRVGFEINSAKTGEIFFLDVDEAITTELTIRFDQNYFSEFPDLRQEYEERKEAIEATAKRSGKKKGEILISNLEHREKDAGGGHEVILRTYEYHDERKKLNQLIDDLYEKNKNNFRSREDIFTLFAKAALSGRLLPIARLIEKTYGRGSFRYLGEKTAKSIGGQKDS